MPSLKDLKPYQLFEGLTDTELASLLPYVHRRTVSKGGYLFYPQSPNLRTYWVESGLVRLFFTNARGNEFLLNLVRPGEVFGLPILDADLPRIIGAVTHQESTILSVESTHLLQAMDTMPQLAKNLYHAASISARMLLVHVRAVITLGLNERLAFLLLRLSAVWQSTDILEMPIRQTELAGWLGVSRGRLNRALNELQKRGLIRMDDKRILLLDRAGLERLAKTWT